MPSAPRNLLLSIFLVFAAAPLIAQNVTVTLAWDPNDERGIAGYRLHYGTVSRAYTQHIDLGNSTSAVVSDLAPGTVYFFAVTAYNTLAVESSFSHEVLFNSPGQTPTPVPTSTPNASQTPEPSPSVTPSPGASPTPSPTPPEQPELLNISTRLFVPPDNNVMIGGFIIYGDSLKRVLLRAIGPSLASFAIPEPMSNPALRVFNSSGSLIASNDNWRSDQAQIIQQSGLAPSNDLEPALLLSLPQGFYSAVVYDVNNSPGVALFEFYDLDPSSSQLLNLSTRGSVLTLDRVLIGGFVTYGNQPITFLLRALGPSLASAGAPDPLLDPSLQLFDSQGSLIFQNDNWRSDQEQQILATHFAPTDERESAIVASLPPGPYTAVVSGTDDSTGTALFEIYRFSQ